VFFRLNGRRVILRRTPRASAAFGWGLGRRFDQLDFFTLRQQRFANLRLLFGVGNWIMSESAAGVAESPRRRSFLFDGPAMTVPLDSEEVWQVADLDAVAAGGCAEGPLVASGFVVFSFFFFFFSGSPAPRELPSIQGPTPLALARNESRFFI